MQLRHHRGRPSPIAAPRPRFTEAGANEFADARTHRVGSFLVTWDHEPNRGFRDGPAVDDLVSGQPRSPYYRGATPAISFSHPRSRIGRR